MKHILLIALFLATSSFAQEDPWDQAVKAALKGTEPEYIKVVLNELTQKRNGFVAVQRIQNTEQRIALTEAMHAILQVILSEIATSAKIAVAQYNGDSSGAQACRITFDSAWVSAMGVLTDTKELPSTMVLSAAKDSLGQGFRKHISDSIWEAIPEAPAYINITPIAYRLGELAGLDWLVENFPRVLRSTYAAARSSLTTQAFSTRLDDKTFHHLPEDVRKFLNFCLGYFPKEHQKAKTDLSFNPQGLLERIREQRVAHHRERNARGNVNDF